MSHRVIRGGAIAAALTLTTVLAGCTGGGGGGETPTGSGPTWSLDFRRRMREGYSLGGSASLSSLQAASHSHDAR